ncbi:MAG: hypothetical protein OXU85_05420 [Thaumarchaeota archaeon]|nr:hypothetical protein [Nitrososphaerota archaeon]
MAGDTRALSGDLKALARIFAGNQKSLASMKGVLDGLADALEAFQKQTRKIGALEDDTQKLFAGIAEMRSHARTIARLDSQAAKMAETVRGIDERTKRADGLGEIARRVEEGFGPMKGGPEAMARIGGHVEAMRGEIGGLLARASAAESMGGDIARLKSILEEIQAKGAGGAEIAAEVSGIAGRVSELAGLPDGVIALQKRLEEISAAAGALGPAVEDLRGQVGRIAEGGAGVAALREEVAAMVKEGVASVSDALGRSEGEAAEVRRRVEEIAGEVRALREEGQRASGSPSAEVMAMLRLSEFQASVRMAAESKRGEVSDLERMASQTAEAVGAFDRLAAESGPGVRLPVGVRQWAVSKMLECAERWEIRFSDLLGVMRERLGAELMREAVRAEQVREAYGARAVDELEGILGGAEAPQEGGGDGGEPAPQAPPGDGEETHRQESPVDGGGERRQEFPGTSPGP